MKTFFNPMVLDDKKVVDHDLNRNRTQGPFLEIRTLKGPLSS